jgi:LemA protein
MALTIAIIVALIIYIIWAYNSLVTMRNRVKEAWSDIDVQLKRRYNLIPNIVETVKGYAAHEEGVFQKVTEARSGAINAATVKDQGAAENMLSGTLKSLFAVAENYPTLKANENFMQLQNELVDTEDKIQSARRFYNGVVRDLNTKVEQFPDKIIADAFKFKAEEFFELENAEEKKAVDVSFKKEEPVK